VEHSVNHVTTFRYGGDVRDSINEVRLRPRTDGLQVCLDFRLITSPPTEIRTYTDYFENEVHTFDVDQPHTILAVTARSRVTTRQPSVSETLAGLPDPYRPLALEEAGELIDFLQPTPRVDFHPDLADFAQAVRRASPDGALGPLVWSLSLTLHGLFQYVPGATDVGTIASDALAARRGVCQDYTHVMLAALRILGIPARYTSGYFHLRSDGGEVGGQASHAWVEAWFPERGWVGVDPTNDRVVDERYIRVAYGRDYADVAPIKGSYRGAETSVLTVNVSVSGVAAQQQQQ
jgi:transglutaminase-like putative cysteine protease